MLTLTESVLVHDISGDLPVDDTPTSLKMVISARGDLVHKNTYTLGRFVSFVKDLVQECKDKSEMGLADIEFAMALLATKIGDRLG